MRHVSDAGWLGQASSAAYHDCLSSADSAPWGELPYILRPLQRQPYRTDSQAMGHAAGAVRERSRAMSRQSGRKWTEGRLGRTGMSAHSPATAGVAVAVHAVQCIRADVDGLIRRPPGLVLVYPFVHPYRPVLAYSSVVRTGSSASPGRADSRALSHPRSVANCHDNTAAFSSVLAFLLAAVCCEQRSTPVAPR